MLCQLLRRTIALPIATTIFASYPSAWASQETAGTAWDAYSKRFIDATFKAQPHFAVSMGRHEFDGQLPDWTASGIKKEVVRLRAARKQAATFLDSQLSERHRFERDYVIAVIDSDLFWLETSQEPFRSPTYYLWALSPDIYVSREYAPLPQRMRAYIAYAKGIPRAARQIQANLRTPLPRSYVRIGRIGAGGLATFYEKEVPTIFQSVQDPKLHKDFRRANAGAIRAMKELDAWFSRQEAAATEDFALGPKKFAEMLHATDRIDVPLPRLKEIAERDLDRNLTALREACKTLTSNEPLDGCVSKVRGDKLSQGPLETARTQVSALRSFVEDRKLVTILGNEQVRVAESPPYQRWNSAYISIPGPYDKNVPAIYYIAPPDPKWTKAEQDAYVPDKNELLFTSVHEVWPGHYLQQQHAHRSRSAVGQLFSNYAFGEGWAHYSEELMWEAGVGNGDPGVQVGQLLNALLRNVRLVSAIGLHTGGMSIAESEAMFREKAFQDPGNARQQADRGTFDPGYGAYTLGKLMIRKLRDDWTAARGGRQAWQAFHDQLLSYGSPPVPIVRKAMLGAASGPPL